MYSGPRQSPAMAKLKLAIETGLLPIFWLGFHSSATFSNFVAVEKRKINTHEAHILHRRAAWATLRPAVSQMSALPEKAIWINKGEDEGCRTGRAEPNGNRLCGWGERGTAVYHRTISHPQTGRKEAMVLHSSPSLSSVSYEFAVLGCHLFYKRRRNTLT